MVNSNHGRRSIHAAGNFLLLNILTVPSDNAACSIADAATRSAHPLSWQPPHGMRFYRCSRDEALDGWFFMQGREENMRSWLIGCVAVLSLLGLGIEAASARSCLIRGHQYRLASDKVDWSMTIASGDRCTRGFNVASGHILLSSSPQSGKVTLRGASFTYTSKPDFQGDDSFALVVSGSIIGIPGNSTIRVNVQVAGGPASLDAPAQRKGASQLKTANGAAPAATQRVAIQVDERDDKVMNLALNNAENVIDYYKAKGEPVTVEIVTFGPGLHMLRADTSPVKDRIATMALENPELAFAACANTQAKMSKAENRPVTLIGEAKLTRSGVVRLLELQEQGYSYIRP
jgi:uncharacterized protein